MRIESRAVLAAIACLALTGCGGDKTPKGQVVATLAGKEITQLELKDELNGFVATNPAQRKAAEQAALEQIIARRALAAAAEKARTAEAPEFARQAQKLHELLLVQTWQSNLQKALPPPARDEVLSFMAAHPDQFAARKLMTVDQIRFVTPADPTFSEKLRPLNTLEDIAALLTQSGINYQTGTDTVDTLAIDTTVVDQIMKLPQNEVFVVPVNNTLIVNRIRDVRVAPITGEAAIARATQLLRMQRAQISIARQSAYVVQQAQGKVKYNPAFAPPAKAAADGKAAGG
jgi:EpsD family peptidyl-prolyl cis-trans isomerase